MAHKETAKTDVAKGNCPECGEPYYHTLQHIGGGTTYIHSDVAVLKAGIDVEYCYQKPESLPASAIMECAALIAVHAGIPQWVEILFDDEIANLRLADLLEEYTMELDGWEEDQDAEFYQDLIDKGDIDDEAYIVEATFRKDHDPYYRLGSRLAFALYEVMLWVLNEAGVENIAEPNVPKASAYGDALNTLAKAYDVYKGIGLKLVQK